MKTIEDVLEHFDNKIDEWHDGDSLVELHTYLGLDVEDYNCFVCYPDEFANKLLNKAGK